MAWVLYSAERVAQAEKSARQAVLYQPDFAMAHLLLGQIHRRQGNFAGMVEDLDAYLTLDPDGARSGAARVARAAAQKALDQVASGEVVARAP